MMKLCRVDEPTIGGFAQKHGAAGGIWLALKKTGRGKL